MLVFCVAGSTTVTAIAGCTMATFESAVTRAACACCARCLCRSSCFFFIAKPDAYADAGGN